MRNVANSVISPTNSADTSSSHSNITTWFTLEFAFWSLIGVGSAALRVWNLGNAALTNSEAANSLSSLALSQGESVSTNNPLFTNLQTLVFTLFGANDFSARIPIAIAGVLLCLVPALLRPSLGRTRALVFAGLLALSPTMIFASHQAEGALLGWVLAFTLWCFWQRGSYRSALIFAGLLLACGADAVSPVIMLLAVFFVEFFGIKPRKHTLQVTRADLSLGGAAFLLAGTGILWRLSGLGDAFNGFAVWPLSLSASPLVGFLRLAIGSLVYEPFIFLCAGCGVTLLLLRRRYSSREASWLVWIVLGLLLLGIDNSRDAVGLVPVVIGSAAYAGIILVQLFASIASEEYSNYPRHAEWVVAALSVIMLVYAYLGLSMYSAQGMSSWLFTSLLGLMLVAGICVVATLTYSATVAIHGVGLAMGLCLLLYTISSGYALIHTRATNPGEAYITEAGDDGLHDLVHTIQTVSTRAYGDPDSIPIQVQGDAPPALHWALREQRGVTYVLHAQNAPSVLTSIDKKPDESNSAYIGSAFRVATSSSLDNIRCAPSAASDQLDCTPLARWLTQRTINERVITRWIFWMRSDIAQKANGQQN
jgi:4-amino-4-deoxy-L-arabinose transferase-like glycosyltransferase